MDKYTVLVIDDDENICKLLNELLSGKQEYRVLIAGDGKMAAKYFCEQRIDVVLTDIHMPGFTGIELMADMQKLNFKPEILVMTANGTPENVEKARNIGARSIVLKPFDNLDVVEGEIEKAVHAAAETRAKEEATKAAAAKTPPPAARPAPPAPQPAAAQPAPAPAATAASPPAPIPVDSAATTKLSAADAEGWKAALVGNETPDAGGSVARPGGAEIAGDGVPAAPASDKAASLAARATAARAAALGQPAPQQQAAPAAPQPQPAPAAPQPPAPAPKPAPAAAPDPKPAPAATPPAAQPASPIAAQPAPPAPQPVSVQPAPAPVPTAAPASAPVPVATPGAPVAAPAPRPVEAFPIMPAELESIFRAGSSLDVGKMKLQVPIVCLQTWDEQGAIAALRVLATSLSREFLTWSASRGIQRENGESMGEMYRDPLRALEFIRRQKNSSLCVLADFRQCLEDRTVVRSLREMVMEGETAREMLVLTAPRLPIPPELQSSSASFDWPSGGSVDLSAVFEEVRAEIEGSTGQTLDIDVEAREVFLSRVKEMPVGRARFEIARTLMARVQRSS